VDLDFFDHSIAEEILLNLSLSVRLLWLLTECKHKLKEVVAIVPNYTGKVVLKTKIFRSRPFHILLLLLWRTIVFRQSYFELLAQNLNILLSVFNKWLRLTQKFWNYRFVFPISSLHLTNLIVELFDLFVDEVDEIFIVAPHFRNSTGIVFFQFDQFLDLLLQHLLLGFFVRKKLFEIVRVLLELRNFVHCFGSALLGWIGWNDIHVIGEDLFSKLFE
jgi:hypothetical protein